MSDSDARRAPAGLDRRAQDKSQNEPENTENTENTERSIASDKEYCPSLCSLDFVFSVFSVFSGLGVGVCGLKITPPHTHAAAEAVRASPLMFRSTRRGPFPECNDDRPDAAADRCSCRSRSARDPMS